MLNIRVQAKACGYKNGLNIFIVFACLIILFLMLAPVNAQDSGLYIPVNIQNAYNKGTRSYDGKPGKKYWQNHSDYKIKVSFDPSSGRLNGTEKITYFNESPDSLDILILRLYQNITRPDALRDFNLDKEALSNGVNIEKLVINDTLIDLINKNMAPGSSTNWVINLPQKLSPEGKIKLEINWDFTIPKGKLPRMGYYGDSSYVVGYWYPQVAVYDDIDGWDKIAYTGQTEFYNDFCNYDVEISVPKNITVWATGVWQNPEEILLPEYLDRYKSAMSSDKKISIIGMDDLTKQKFKGGETTIWKYKAEKVPDFVFAVAGRYLWDAESVVADSNTGRRVLINTAYDPSSKDFYEVADIAHKTIEMLSGDFPGVPYPYPAMTVFNGSGGMEFPMLVNDGSAFERYVTVHVTSHEITHTYFPFYMGTNERKYAWMDEGWATMIPFKIQSAIEPSYDPIGGNVKTYLANAGKESDVPPVIPSYLLKGTAYRMASYNRPGEAYKYLRETLGREKFDNTLREFIYRWNGKHPSPYDFFFTFDKASGESLNWFWKPWFFEEAYPDLAIKEVKIENDKLNILVEKKGAIPIPVIINVFDENDEILSSVTKDLNVWKTGVKEVWLEVERKGNPVLIKLGNNKTPDVYQKNNIYYLKGSSIN